MTLAVCDWTAHNESRPRVIRGIALGADLLIRCSEDNWCLYHVLGTGTKVQNETSAGGLEGKVQTIGYSVDWGRGDTRCIVCSI
jgi:hypothetical protein